MRRYAWGWGGMRGFVTIATAFRFADNFPQRDTVVLTAFCVVIATLVLRPPLICHSVKLLTLDRSGYAALALSVLPRAAPWLRRSAGIGRADGPEAENSGFRLSPDTTTCRRETVVESLDRYLSSRTASHQRRKDHNWKRYSRKTGLARCLPRPAGTP